LSEKINYVIFFVIALAIVSVAIYIERPESLASAIPGLIEEDATDEESDTTEADSGDATDEESDTVEPTQEGPEGDGDGETNDDVNATKSVPEGPEGDGDGETNDDTTD
jgi:hypothetical protein